MVSMIKNLINVLERGADVVIASRFLKKGTHQMSDYFLNSFLSFVIRIVTGKHITDSQSGLKAVKREVLKRIRLKFTGMEFETAFVVKALKNGYRLAEIPVEVHPEYFTLIKNVGQLDCLDL